MGTPNEQPAAMTCDDPEINAIAECTRILRALPDKEAALRAGQYALALVANYPMPNESPAESPTP